LHSFVLSSHNHTKYNTMARFDKFSVLMIVDVHTDVALSTLIGGYREKITQVAQNTKQHPYECTTPLYHLSLRIMTLLLEFSRVIYVLRGIRSYSKRVECGGCRVAWSRSEFSLVLKCLRSMILLVHS
jgi:hypothetical protein